jgi:hypothetical protein
MPLPKSDRLAEFFRRLERLPSVSTHHEARNQIMKTLNDVEDQFSGVPFDPNRWLTDGRMYPPQDDSASDVPGYPDVTSYRSRGHETLIGSNGAFEIRDIGTDKIIFEKNGSNGKAVRS